MTTINEIVEAAVLKASKDMLSGKLDLKSVIYQAVQEGMADAFERGAASTKGWQSVYRPVIDSYGQVTDQYERVD